MLSTQKESMEGEKGATEILKFIFLEWFESSESFSFSRADGTLLFSLFLALLVLVCVYSKRIFIRRYSKVSYCTKKKHSKTQVTITLING